MSKQLQSIGIEHQPEEPVLVEEEQEEQELPKGTSKIRNRLISLEKEKIRPESEHSSHIDQTITEQDQENETSESEELNKLQSRFSASDTPGSRNTASFNRDGVNIKERHSVSSKKDQQHSLLTFQRSQSYSPTRQAKVSSSQPKFFMDLLDYDDGDDDDDDDDDANEHDNTNDFSKERNIGDENGGNDDDNDDDDENTSFIAGSSSNLKKNQSPTAVDRSKISSEPHKRRLSTRSLLVLLFFIVSGGPVGSEEAISSMGPLFGLLALVIFPWVYSIPIAMVCAELATAFPDDGGYTLWVADAFGPFWAFQEGYLSWVGGVIDNAMYPVLVVDILQAMIFPELRLADTPPGAFISDHSVARIFFTTSLACLLTSINFAGIRIVGRSLVILFIIVIVPYVICVLLAIPYLQPSRWLIGPPWINSDNRAESSHEQERNNHPWLLLLNTVFWNYSGWDGISTFAGEVRDPTRSYPKALLLGVIMVSGVVILPLLAVIGYDDGTNSLPPWQSWTDGSFVDIGAAIGGQPLRFMILISSLASTAALFNTVMFVGSYLLLGMSEQGLAPAIFSHRHPKYDSPVYSILASLLVIVLVMSFLGFRSLMLVNNFLSSISLVLEIAAAIHLRFSQPNRKRPFHIPVSAVWFTLLLMPAMVILGLVIFGALYSIDRTGLYILFIILGVGGVMPWISGVRKSYRKKTGMNPSGGDNINTPLSI